MVSYALLFRFKFLVNLSLFFLFFPFNQAKAQILEKTSSNQGTNKSFSYSIQSTYGVSTSATATPNLRVDTEAVLKLQKGSFVTNKSGAIGGETGAVFTATPNGANFSLTGVNADNKFLIDDGTKFRASLVTTDLDGKASVGSASATANHTLTVSVNNGESSFSNYIRSNFSGVQ
jgi:hypothetical protein